MMGKRYSESNIGEQASTKRPKVSEHISAADGKYKFGSARELSQILAFDQNAKRAQQGINAFKAFLDSFAEPGADNGPRIALLKDFLASQVPTSDDDESVAPYLSDVIQSWSFASQSNNDSLLSACPAVLALLLKTISPILELSEYGLRLGRTLLLRRQQELIARGVSSNKTKDALISPALRLLREIAIFDGGSMAKQVFKTRDMTFKSLPRNLGLRIKGDGTELPKKPSIRTNALRLVLAMMKFLPTELRREFLNHREVSFAITRDIFEDPPFMVRDVLETLRLYVLLDEKLPRDAKTKVVNAISLSNIASLYRYTQADIEDATNKKTIESLAHDLLVLACTSTTVGVLHRQTGFYPRGVNPDEVQGTDSSIQTIDLGLDSIDWQDKFKENIPVRNTMLSEFIQTLRPWLVRKHSELLLLILEVAPELIANYFYGKKTFSFDPKPTEIWMAYSAFIFSVLQIPIPPYFGHYEDYARLPPPLPIMLENLLPTALSQKTMVRCLHHEEKIISFYAIQLLSKVLLNLQKVLAMYREAAEKTSSKWTQAAEKLINDISLRFPSIKDVISVFRMMPQTDLMQREAIVRLLVLYYEVIPEMALDAKFDVSTVLAQTLQNVEQQDLTPNDRALRLSELQHLFQFAYCSPGTRWFTKANQLLLSPFTLMLKLSTATFKDLSMANLRTLLDSLVKEYQLFQDETSVSALDSLTMVLSSLSESKDVISLDTIYSFLDECISRCAANPVRYICALEEYRAELGLQHRQRPCSLLTMAIVEQWPFHVQRGPDTMVQEIPLFLARYMATMIKIGEDIKVIHLLIPKMVRFLPKQPSARQTINASLELVNSIKVPEARTWNQPDPSKTDPNPPFSQEEGEESIAAMLAFSDKAEDHSSLTRWINKDVEEAIDEGHSAALIMLLSSSHLSIRREALINITKFCSKLKESGHEAKDQIWLLLSELVESSEAFVDQYAISGITTAFASHSIAILTNPLHPLYEKVNHFLSQGPTWNLDKVPLLYAILDDVPTLDNTHYTEISWLLEYLLVGLRTEHDLSIFCRRRVFEKILSLYNSAFAGHGIKSKILRILLRATDVEGGCSILITRLSIISWLQGQIGGGGEKIMRVLLDRIIERCEDSQIRIWSRGGVDVVKGDSIEDAS